MKRAKTGTILIVTVLLAFLALALIFLYYGWVAPSDVPGQEMSGAGWVAMILGALVTLGLGVGLMMLMFHSSRSGHDERQRGGEDDGRN